MTGLSTSTILTPVSSLDEPNPVMIQRRSFLLAAAAGVTLASMPAWLQRSAAWANPLPANQGTFVLLTMAGGNDGLNTFVPFADGAYHTARGGLAFDRNETLPFSAERGFNNRLPYMKRLWDIGNVALIDGVGQPDGNLSHFESMDNWMAASRSVGTTGWLGRFADGAADNPFATVSIGQTTPLVLRGDNHQAITVPAQNAKLFTSDNAASERSYQALKRLGVTAGGSRSMQQAAGESIVKSVEYSADLHPHLLGNLDEPDVVSKMRFAAKLLNADIGVRVISVLWGDFDSHSGQPQMHNARMDELNAALEAFYGTLNANLDNRTVVMGVSEFGRRVKANGSNGTDHGKANTVFAIGSSVNGGEFGQVPSLSNLDNGNTQVHVDFKNVFANVIDTWLDGDSQSLIGSGYDDLGFLNAADTRTGEPPPTTIPTQVDPEEPMAPLGEKVTINRQIARLYLAFFLRDPDSSGWTKWVAARRSGESLASIANKFAQSKEFSNTYGRLSNREFVQLAYQNILGRDPDSAGWNSWTEQLNSGKSRGQVVIGFSESKEFKASTESHLLELEETGPIGRLYWAYFLRRPDTAGLHNWINSDLSTTQVSIRFTQSAEFRDRYGSLSNQDFVELIYRNVLERDPDTAGLANWVSALESGQTRGKVMTGFSNSAEFRDAVNHKYT